MLAWFIKICPFRALSEEAAIVFVLEISMLNTPRSCRPIIKEVDEFIAKAKYERHIYG